MADYPWDKLISEHFSKGGTGVTNFHERQYRLYEEAIRFYADPDLVIGDPIGLLRGNMDFYALHLINGLKELGEFWEAFDRIKAIRTKAGLLEKEWPNA